MHTSYYFASIQLPKRVLFILSGVNNSSADTKFRIAFQVLLFRLSEMPCLVRRAAVCSKMTGNRQLLIHFLAHLSRRLIGELIVYPWSGVRRRRPSYVVRRPQCSDIFFSETTWPIEAKFYVEPPWVGGTIFCLRHLGHMTKMAATPIYGKNPSKIFFSRTGRPIFTKLGM